MARRNADLKVERPLKISEHELLFATRDAQKGWTDLRATARDAAVDAWDFLTKTPELEGDKCYRLKGDLGVITIDGVDRAQWQYKPTSGGRIWYAAVPAAKGSKDLAQVVLLRVVTGHPNETVKQHR